MSCAYFYLALLCLTTCWQGHVECQDKVPREISLKNQLFNDIFLLKEGVDRLQMSVGYLNKSSTCQSELLRGMQTKILSLKPEDSCSKHAKTINDTLRNYQIFEGRTLNKLAQIEQEQDLNFNKLQIRFDKLNKQKYKFNLLEEHLMQQHKEMQNFIARQEKLGHELKTALLKTQDKLNKMQEQLDVQSKDWSKVLEEVRSGKPSK